MEFRILGPLEVFDEQRPIAVAAAKQRALLAVLLLHANEVVSRERLIDELWGERPPATAAKVVQAYVSQLRRRLGRETIATRGPGYQLQVDENAVDATRFRRLVAEARRLATGGDYEPAARAYGAALALWRGPPLADVAVESFARNEIKRLEEERLAALADRIDCQLALGHHEQLVPELETLVGQHPLRERLHAQLMLALYRAGRQADALAAYQETRRTLVDELGLEPSTDLRQLEKAILAHNPALAAPTPVHQRQPRSNLPAQPTSFLGRKRELAEVLALLARKDVRLLTFTGPGGSGKTRLALQAAAALGDDYDDGVCWVPLSALRDQALVLESVAQALGTKRELAEHLGDKRLLLLLDNFEHLLEAAAAVAGLLAACPRLDVLVTSREPLHLAAEREYLVPTLAEAEAVELFRERAHEAQPEQAIIEICRRLDCLPLAIELAAARTKLLPPDRLLRRLGKRLPLLTGGPRDAPERQRTLLATIAWSHELLTDEEKKLFARLAVFAGGCTLEAAEQVCQADVDTLQALVDKNLIRRDGERYWMLETIKEYAAEQLTNAELADLRRRHAAWVIEMLAEGSTPWYGRTTPEWLARADHEQSNVREALLHLAEHGPPEELARLVALMRNFWFLKGPVAEAARWLQSALAGVGRTSSHYGELLLAQSAFLRRLGERDRALAAAEEAVEYFRARQSAEGLVSALRAVGAVYEERGDLDVATALIGEAFALGRQIGYPDLAVVAFARAELELERRRWERGREMVREAAALATELGDDNVTMWSVEALAFSFLGEGRYDDARETVASFVEAAFASDKTIFVVDALNLLAVYAAGQSCFADAARLIGAADALGEVVPRGRDALEAELIARAVSDGRTALGADEWERALSDGAALAGTSPARLAREALATAEGRRSDALDAGRMSNTRR
jgi:predicted ATPase/DNA-binding SARP family transcriptional activator